MVRVCLTGLTAARAAASNLRTVSRVVSSHELSRPRQPSAKLLQMLRAPVASYCCCFETAFSTALKGPLNGLSKNSAERFTPLASSSASKILDHFPHLTSTRDDEVPVTISCNRFSSALKGSTSRIPRVLSESFGSP